MKWPCFIKVLEEKLESYKELGHRVVLHKDPLVVVIVTPIMLCNVPMPFEKRQRLHSSTQQPVVIARITLTFILAPCAAGAVPLGILITTSQSAADYITEPDCFSGNGHPLTFITDDSDAESAPYVRSSLRVTQGCLFHVQQAVWRWLWDAKHCMTKLTDIWHVNPIFKRYIFVQ